MSTEVRVSLALTGELLCTCLVDLSHTVRDLKQQIEKLEGTPSIRQRLLAKDRVLLSHEDVSCFIHGVQSELAAAGGIPDLHLIRLGEEYSNTLNDVEAGRIELEDLREELRNDFDIAFAAVQIDGFAIRHVNGPLKNNKMLVMAAMHESGAALKLVRGNLLQDPEVLLAAVSNFGNALQHVPSELRADRSLALAAVRQDPQSIKFVPDCLLDDRDFALAVLRQQPTALRFMSSRLQSDPEVVLSAVSGNDRDYSNLAAILAAEGSLLLDRDFAFKLVRTNGLALRYLSTEMREDHDLVFAAMEENTRALWCASPTLKHDQTFQLKLKSYFESSRQRPAED